MRNKLKKDVDLNPIMLDNTPMKEVTSAKYLGDQVTTKLSLSISATVKKRAGVATATIYEIRAVIDDNRADSLVALPKAFMI